MKKVKWILAGVIVAFSLSAMACPPASLLFGAWTWLHGSGDTYAFDITSTRMQFTRSGSAAPGDFSGDISNAAENSTGDGGTFQTTNNTGTGPYSGMYAYTVLYWIWLLSGGQLYLAADYSATPADAMSGFWNWGPADPQ